MRVSPPIRTRMTARSIDEPHRTASQLELLFDLTFVIAVAALTNRFAHAIAEGHALDVLVPFLLVFFAIWWAWTNYTWFASSFDTDDVPFRLLTMTQMGGVLVLAAGVPAALDHGDFRAVTIGYLIMRLALVAQWLRAAIEDPASRATALRYATAITIAEVAWILRLAARRGRAPVRHGAARGLRRTRRVRAGHSAVGGAQAPHAPGIPTTSLNATACSRSSCSAKACSPRHSASNEPRPAVTGASIMTGAAALVLVFALWWLYFLQPAGDGLARRRERSYLWGYGHYGIFAALAAVGAGLEVAVEQTGHHVAASPVAIGYAVAIPVAIVLILLWALHAPICAPPVLKPGGDLRRGRRDPRPAARGGVHTARPGRGGDRGRVRPSRRAHHLTERHQMESTIVLVHGAFAESASWNGVIDPLVTAGHRVIAAANPLRGLAADAEALATWSARSMGPSCSSATPTAARSSPTSTPTRARSSGWSMSPASRRTTARAASRSPGCSRAARSAK